MLRNEPSTSTAHAGPHHVLKIIVVGDSNVGKTCLTYRFCERTFLKIPEATIGVDFHEKEIRIGNQDVKIWDTAGQERFRKSMVNHYYRNVHAVIVVYNLTKYMTFKNVKGWIEECTKYGLNKNIPRILVATHKDGNPQNRAVTSLKGQNLADKYGMLFYETSAKLDSEAETVNSIFITLAQKLIDPASAGTLFGIEENARMGFAISSLTRSSTDSRIYNKRKCC